MYCLSLNSKIRAFQTLLCLLDVQPDVLILGRQDAVLGMFYHHPCLLQICGTPLIPRCSIYPKPTTLWRVGIVDSISCSEIIIRQSGNSLMILSKNRGSTSRNSNNATAANSLQLGKNLQGRSFQDKLHRQRLGIRKSQSLILSLAHKLNRQV